MNVIRHDDQAVEVKFQTISSHTGIDNNRSGSRRKGPAEITTESDEYYLEVWLEMRQTAAVFIRVHGAGLAPLSNRQQGTPSHPSGDESSNGAPDCQWSAGRPRPARRMPAGNSESALKHFSILEKSCQAPVLTISRLSQ